MKKNKKLTGSPLCMEKFKQPYSYLKFRQSRQEGWLKGPPLISSTFTFGAHFFMSWALLSSAQAQNNTIQSSELNQKTSALVNQFLGETEPRTLQDYAIGGNLLGKIWLTEEPSLLQAQLSVSAPQVIAVQEQHLFEPIPFSISCNYTAFLSKAEIYLYKAQDQDRISPVKIIPVPLDPYKNQLHFEWKDSSWSSKDLKEGQGFNYVLRVYNTSGHWDETTLGYIHLVSPSQREQYLEKINNQMNSATKLRSSELGLTLEQFQLGRSLLGSNQLAVQNILLQGSRVRLRGHGIPEGVQLKINGQTILIDNERKFVSEYLLPLGKYDFKLEGRDQQGTHLDSMLQAYVRGEYWLLIALADLTASENTYIGKIESIRPEDLEYFSKDHVDGRLAFYLKGKIKGRYLLTAQLDTEEKDLKDLLKNILKADRADLLKRIDPDAYYPIYGDDSISKRDVDTNGRLYVRVDWDKNTASWGNLQTDFNGTQLANYQRSLYGAKLQLKSLQNTSLGQPYETGKFFFAEQVTSPAQSEFLGTGGSLYYLHNTDLVPQSETVRLEVRDPLTGRVKNSYSLQANRDYEINYYQGRLILTRPLSQITKDNSPLRESSADELQNYLVIQYEYYPTGFDKSNYSMGANVQHRLKDNFALGWKAVKEQKAGKDYELLATDLTLQQGLGTWVKLEQAHSQSIAAPIYYSSDGGLSFTQYGPSLLSSLAELKGKARSIEIRINTKEQQWTENQWKFAAWHRQQTPGYSVAHISQLGTHSENSGTELIGQITDSVQVLMGYKKVETNYNSNKGVEATQKNAQLTSNSAPFNAIDSYNTIQHQQQERFQLAWMWQPDSEGYLNFELQQLVKKQAQDKSQTEMAGVKLLRKWSNQWEWYVSGQTPLAKSQFPNNRSISLGTQYQFENGSKASIDWTNGQNGQAITIAADYKRNSEHSLYGNYAFSPTDLSSAGTSINNSSDGLISSIEDSGFQNASKLTLGQSYKISDQVKLIQETQQQLSDKNNGLLHNIGLDFTNHAGFSLATNVQKGVIKNLNTGLYHRRESYSLSAGMQNSKIEWSSKIEYRLDREQSTQPNGSNHLSVNDSQNNRQEQWFHTNKIQINLANHWRMLGKLNYALTQSTVPHNHTIPSAANRIENIKSQTDAQLFDSNLGFAWRPPTGRLNALFKHQFYFDLAPAGQTSTTGSLFDQRSHISSIEATYILNPSVEIGAKLASRQSRMRIERGQGEWFNNHAQYAAAQVRYYVGDKGVETDGSAKNIWAGWSVMTEYRQLKVAKDGTKSGFLIVLDKDLGKNLRFGVGYNFTDFSSDLTQLSYKHKGAFINLVMTLGISR